MKTITTYDLLFFTITTRREGGEMVSREITYDLYRPVAIGLIIFFAAHGYNVTALGIAIWFGLGRIATAIEQLKEEQP